jgi:ankyrin repeat protein
LDWINWEKSFLHFAAATGSFDLVKSMLDRRPDLLDKQDDMGQTPLLLALQSGDLHTVQYLIAQGADCQKADVNGVTAMHWAAMLDGEERKTIIFKLREKCAPVDVGAKIISGHGQTPSHLLGAAAINGTPLMWAISLSDPDSVDALLEVGADPTCRPFSKDNSSPFEVACQLYEPQILKKFLSKPNVRLDVMRSRPLVHEGPSRLVQPLFFALSGGSRWDRLIRQATNL